MSTSGEVLSHSSNDQSSWQPPNTATMDYNSQHHTALPFQNSDYHCACSSFRSSNKQYLRIFLPCTQCEGSLSMWLPDHTKPLFPILTSHDSDLYSVCFGLWLHALTVTFWLCLAWPFASLWLGLRFWFVYQFVMHPLPPVTASVSTCLFWQYPSI